MKKTPLHFAASVVLSLFGIAGALSLQGTSNSGAPTTQAASTALAAHADANIYCVAIISSTYPGCTQVFTNVQTAIDVATQGDLVKIASGVYTDLHLREGITQVVFLSKTLTLQGGYTTTNWTVPNPEANHTTLDAQGQSRVLYITGGITPTVEGLRITGGHAGLGGGLYVDRAGGILHNNKIVSNAASLDGGGIFLYRTSMLVSNNALIANTANQNGGGIYLWDSTAMVTGNLVLSNTALDSGGGLYPWYGVNTIVDNQVANNRALQEGGGLYLDHSVQTVTNNLITSNTANLGGGLFADTVTGLVQDNTVSSNTASLDGGGIFLYRAPTTVTRNSFIANTAGQNGGGIYLWDGVTAVTGNLVLSNTALNNGGGLYPWYGVNTIINNHVANNMALNRGGGIFFDHSTQTIDGNIIVSNAAQYGGGLYLLALLPTTLSNTVVADNQASVGGSGMYIDVCTPTFLQTTIARNGGGDGSGVYLGTGSGLAMTNTIVAAQAAGVLAVAGSQATLNGVLWHSNTTNYTGAGTIVAMNEITGTSTFIADGYHVAAGSIAIDHGLDTSVNHDLDDDPRPIGNGYDLGADEFETGLMMTKQVDAHTVRAGAQLTYTIFITNNGIVDLHAVVTDTLPDQVAPTGILTWTAIVTAFDGTWTQPVVVTVTPGYSGTLVNHVRVTSQEGATGEAQVAANAIGYKIYLPLILRD